MGKISDRIMGSVDEFAGRFGDRLMTWGGKVLSAGGTRIAEELEPAGVDLVADTLKQIQDNPLTPDTIKGMLNKLIKPNDPVPLFVVILLAPLILIPLVTGIFQPLQRLLNYGQERLFRSGRMDPGTAIRSVWRGFMTEDRMRATLVDHGFDELDIDTLIDVTKFYPPPADLVRFQAREVFEPDMIAKYGLDDELAGIEREPFYKAGMTEEQITNYWRAHWEHASWMQMVEMLHRGLVTEEDVYEWFKVVEVVPHWRDLLIQTAYTWPTRVDVRRWWDMRTIDETELRRLYSGMGYRGVNLDNYILWTKVYVAFPDLMARWSKGWITEDDVRTELVSLGMPAERVEEMIQTKVKPTEQDPISDAKKVSQTAIIKWVKEDIEARWEEGVDLLMDLGYDENGARFVLDAYIAEAGSPETYEDWKRVTDEYKRAAGREIIEMPEELKAAAGEVVRLTKEVKDLEEAVIEEEKKLLDLEPRPPEAEVRLKELQVFRNRAIAELSRVKSDYSRLIAEWRHSQA